MRFPANLIDVLIKHDAFRVCRIMPEREFIRYCKERGIDVDPARLRQFERIGVFRPMLRVFRPEITYKIELVDQGWRYAGELEPGEKWDGEAKALASTSCRSSCGALSIGMRRRILSSSMLGSCLRSQWPSSCDAVKR